MAVQQFCLRWNNHQPNFISVFTNLLNNESLVDVTLAAEGKQLKAHKVVLSACSTYFQSLFTANPCQHPIVILKDVKYTDLKTMVDFMYQGEVNVSQEQLPAILKTAETLKVKGLAEMPEQLSLSKSVNLSSEKCDSPTPTTSPSVLRRKRFRKSSTGSGSEQTSEETAASGSGSTDIVSPSPVKHEPDEASHRRDTSTESEPRDGSHSFEDEPSTPRNLSEDAGDSNIRWSSTEEKASTSQGTPQVVEPSATASMGSKRGRLLMRQHRIKKESEMLTVEGEVGAGHGGPSEGQARVERQYSEPASPALLTVPHHQGYLVKQNSSPHLSSTVGPPPAPPPAALTPVPTVHILPPSPAETVTSPPTAVPSRHRIEELRRTTSSPQCSGTGAEGCEGSRSCHCPVLRPGPALGCNFCWNTIDTHGRILRRKTKYHCPECQTNLCIVPCFQEYHERQGSGTGFREGPSSNCSPSPGSSGVMFPTIMKTSSL